MKDGVWTLIGKPGSAQGIIDVLIHVSSSLGRLETFRFFHNAHSRLSGSIVKLEVAGRRGIDE